MARKFTYSGGLGLAVAGLFLTAAAATASVTVSANSPARVPAASPMVVTLIPPAMRAMPGSISARRRAEQAELVLLGGTFTPPTVPVHAGERILLLVTPLVKATLTGLPKDCEPGRDRPGADGLLGVRCLGGGRYLFTARRAGITVLSAVVGPACRPSVPCAQWRTMPTLMVVVRQGPSQHRNRPGPDHTTPPAPVVPALIPVLNAI